MRTEFQQLRTTLAIAAATWAGALALGAARADEAGHTPFVMPTVSMQEEPTGYPNDVHYQPRPTEATMLPPQGTVPSVTTPRSLSPPPSSPNVSPFQPDDPTPNYDESGGNVTGHPDRAIQYPDNFFWGCGGSPYRTGPGLCDDWLVGPMWDVAVDGMTLFRQNANLAALQAATSTTSGSGAVPLPPPNLFDQFDYGAGGRVFLTGKLPCCGYQVQAVYEGVEQWNASIVYPKQTIDPSDPPNKFYFFPPAGVDPTGFSEQSSMHYTSSLHSGELNFMRTSDAIVRPYFGVRYIRFADEVNYTINQEVLVPPIPVAVAPARVYSATDIANIFEDENNLIGFQMGLHEDMWRFGDRFSIEGFVNSGVYYNRVKRSNLMLQTTTTYQGDINSQNPAVPSVPGTTTVSNSANLDTSEPTDIAYVCEASLSGVLRFNRCVALRAGYQFMWIDGVQLAEDGFLYGGDGTRTLVFHGWHAGVEYRR